MFVYYIFSFVLGVVSAVVATIIGVNYLLLKKAKEKEHVLEEWQAAATQLAIRRNDVHEPLLDTASTRKAKRRRRRLAAARGDSSSLLRLNRKDQFEIKEKQNDHDDHDDNHENDDELLSTTQQEDEDDEDDEENSSSQYVDIERRPRRKFDTDDDDDGKQKPIRLPVVFGNAFKRLASACLSCSESLFDGVLWIRSPLIRAVWRRRYFRLYPGLLVMYSSASRHNRTVQGLVALSKAALRVRADVSANVMGSTRCNLHVFEVWHASLKIVQLRLLSRMINSTRIILAVDEQMLRTDWLVWLRSGVMSAPDSDFELELAGDDDGGGEDADLASIAMQAATSNDSFVPSAAFMIDQQQQGDGDGDMQGYGNGDFNDFSFGSSDDDEYLSSDSTEDSDSDVTDSASSSSGSENDEAVASSEHDNVGGGDRSMSSSVAEHDDAESAAGTETATTTDFDSVIIRRGMLKMRGAFRSWHERWFELRPGILLYKRARSASSAMNVVLLLGCVAEERESRMSGYSFVVRHPDGNNIYSSKGLDGASLALSKFPGGKGELIMRCDDKHVRDAWLRDLRQMTSMSLSSIVDKPILRLYASCHEHLVEQHPHQAAATVDDSQSLAHDSVSSSSTSSSSLEPVVPIEIGDATTNRSKKKKRRGRRHRRGGAESSPAAASSSDAVGGDEQANGGEPIHVPNADDSTDLYFDGYCQVRDFASNTWLRKWIIVKPGIVLFFKSEDSSNCQGMINLHSCQVRGIWSPPNLDESEPTWRALQEEPLLGADNDKLLVAAAADKSSNTLDADALRKLAELNAVTKNVGVDIFHPLGGKVFVSLPDFNKDSSKSSSSSSSSVSSDVVDPLDEKKSKSKKSKATIRSIGARCLLRVATRERMCDWVQLIGEAMQIEQTEFPVMFPVFTEVPKRSPTESCEWFNLVLSKYFAEMQANELFVDKIRAKMQYRFNKIKKPNYVGPIVVEEVDIGRELVQLDRISFAQRRQDSDAWLRNRSSELIGEAHVEYRGGASVKITFNVYINWPRPRFATIPVSAWLRIERVSGVLRLFAPSEVPSRISLAFIDMPLTDFSVRLIIGSTARNVNLTNTFPRVKNFLTATLRKLIWKTAVSPNKVCLSFPLPGHKMRLRTHKATSRRSRARRQAERAAYAAASQARDAIRLQMEPNDESTTLSPGTLAIN
jgi:Maintenance of mitochondrial morphology protein 1/PH domain